MIRTYARSARWSSCVCPNDNEHAFVRPSVLLRIYLCIEQ